MTDKKLESKLTLKQKKWIKEYLKSGNASKAAMKVYDCKDMVSASTIGSENLRKLATPLKTFMEARGLSIGRLLEVLDDGLGSKKVISAQVINKAGDGMKQANSMTKDFIEVPDHATRHKYLETAARWLGVGTESKEPKVKRRMVAEEFFSDGNIPLKTRVEVSSAENFFSDNKK